MRQLTHIWKSLLLSAAGTWAAWNAAQLLRMDILSFKTGLYFFGALGIFILLLMRLAFALFKVPRPKRQNFQLFTLSLFAALFFMELTLRGFGVRVTYAEQNGNGAYLSVFEGENLDSWYHVHRPYDTLVKENAEFNWRREINALGLSERALELEKGEGEFRLLALGDSFTEGDGVAYDSTWLKCLERALQEQALPPRHITTINAGIGGSDPVFGAVLFRDRLKAYRPDVVIVSINDSDMSDIAKRGGFERFKPNGKVQIREPYEWEWLYGISYTIRLVVHGVLGYSEFLDLDELHPLEDSPDRIMEALGQLETDCAEVGARMVVVTHPLSYDLEDAAYRNAEMQRLRAQLATSGYRHFDVLDYLVASGYSGEAGTEALFWPLNQHFNAKGYRMYGEGLAAWLGKACVLPRLDSLSGIP